MTDIQVIKKAAEAATPVRNLEASGNAVHERISDHYATCIVTCHGSNRHKDAELIALLLTHRDELCRLAEIGEAFERDRAIERGCDSVLAQWTKEAEETEALYGRKK